MNAITIVALIAVIGFLMVDRRRAELSWSRERAGLLQRIQAPDRAIAAQARQEEVAARPRRRVRPVALDDDDAMNKAIEGDGDGGA